MHSINLPTVKSTKAVLLAVWAAGCSPTGGQTNAGSCTTTQVDGGAVISCPDGTSSRINHAPDTQGCTAQRVDGGIEVACNDGTRAVVRDGESGGSCRIDIRDAGTFVSCDDGTVARLPDSSTGVQAPDGGAVDGGDGGSSDGGGVACTVIEGSVQLLNSLDVAALASYQY